MAELCRQRTAAQLADKRRDDVAYAEQNERGGEAREIEIHADCGEENRGEEHIPQHIGLIFHVRRLLQRTAQHDPRDVGARDIRDAENLFGYIGIHEAGADGENGNAAVMGIFALDLIEQFSQKDTRPDGEEEERENFKAYQPPRRIFPPRGHKGDERGFPSRRGRKAREHGQNDDPDYVVDHGGGDDGSTYFCVQFSQLFQGGDGDAYRCRGEDCAVKEIPEKASSLMKRPRYQRSQSHGYNYAEQCDDHGRGARGF